MKACPVCGHAEELFIPAEPRQLLTQRLRNIIYKNAANSWWFTQPEWACKWLARYVNPRTIVDVGCGDGRWLPAIISSWPEAHYTGIDRIGEHISLNQEKLPEYEWVNADMAIKLRLAHTGGPLEADGRPSPKNRSGAILERFRGHVDLVFLMGIFNPGLAELEQSRLLYNIMHIKPSHIVSSYDRNSTGRLPHSGLHKYQQIEEIEIPKSEQGPSQSVIAWIFKAKD